MTTLLTAICIACVAATLYAERQADAFLRLIAKSIASACFVAIAALHAMQSSDPAARWVVTGLSLGALGDIALSLPGRRWLLRGLVLFLIGHLFYLAAFATWSPPANWVSVWALFPILVAVRVIAYVWPHAGGLRRPVLIYIVTFTVLAAAATSLLSRPPLHLGAVGVWMFFLSDIAVARHRFVAIGFENKLVGLPLYYGGQLLLAWQLASG